MSNQFSLNVLKSLLLSSLYSSKGFSFRCDNLSNPNFSIFSFSNSLLISFSKSSLINLFKELFWLLLASLTFKGLNYGVDFSPSKRPIKEKYICIGPRSTAGIKEWPYDNWRKLADKLNKKGYKVVNIS